MVQSVRDSQPKRTDHVWYRKDGNGFKCCLCGALTNKPPDFPTPVDWMPEMGYEQLTETERTICVG